MSCVESLEGKVGGPRHGACGSSLSASLLAESLRPGLLVLETAWVDPLEPRVSLMLTKVSSSFATCVANTTRSLSLEPRGSPLPSVVPFSFLSPSGS